MGDFSVILPLPKAVAEYKASAFTQLAGWALLMHSVEAMRGDGFADGGRIVVATAQPLLADVEACLAAHRVSGVDIVAVGGAGTRTDCIRAGVERLAAMEPATRYILIHDHRRPLASADIRERVIARLRGGSDVVLPMLGLVDSVKAVNDEGSVVSTIDRATLSAVQYPRGFSARTLAELVARCTDDQFNELDEARAAGLAVEQIDGDPDAFVVDVPRDLRLIEAIISCRRADRR